MHRIRKRLTERNVLICLLIFFICLTIWIVTVPYEPLNDKADATANLIWKDYYKDGRYAVPYDEWQQEGHPNSQSSVVEIDGEPLVVNEKGPGHAIFCMVLGKATGTFFAGLMVISTYMLGRRVFNWRVGAMASVIIMTNLVVMVMWHRYLWVDSSTMPLCVLGMWLFVESGLRIKKYIETRGAERNKDLMMAFLFGLGGGVSFGAAVSTRYTVGIMVIAPVIYVLALFIKAIIQRLKKRDIKGAIKNLGRALFMLLPFLIGLFIILVPLMNYNNTYFGGPFRSGYDATTIQDYQKSGDLEPRNQTDYLKSNWGDKLKTIGSNAVTLFPVMVQRILALIMVPYAVWKLRKRPILYLLLPWMLLIFIAFFSLTWVGMYANLVNVYHEPRYAMPAYPAIALMAAYSIDSICIKGPGHRKGGPGTREAAFAIAMVAMLVLPGMVQAHTHFSDLRDGFGKERPPNQPAKPDDTVILTIDELYKDPFRVNDNLIEIRGCEVTYIEKGIGGEVIWFNVTDRSSPETVLVRPVEYPQGELPPLDIGTRVLVSGMFEFRDQNTNNKPDPGELVVKVKYGTKDRIEIIK
jgi:4-amino-4-deoxy-L-arabinose transferase-like glycosyltransferase